MFPFPSCWFGIWNQHPHWLERFCPGLSSHFVLGNVRTLLCMDRAGLLVAELRVSLGLSTANSGVATLVCLVNWFAPVATSQETMMPCFDCKENKHHSCGKRKLSGYSKDRDSSGAKEKQKEPSYRIFILFPRDSASSLVLRNHWGLRLSVMCATSVILWAFICFLQKNKAILTLVACPSSLQLESCWSWGTLSSVCRALLSPRMTTFKRQCVYKGWGELRWVLLEGLVIWACAHHCSLSKGLLD